MVHLGILVTRKFSAGRKFLKELPHFVNIWHTFLENPLYLAEFLGELFRLSSFWPYFGSSSIESSFRLAIFHRKVLEILLGYQKGKNYLQVWLRVVFHQRLCSPEDRLPLKVIFHCSLSSTEGHISSKGVLQWRSSSIKGYLPMKVVFDRRSSSIQIAHLQYHSFYENVDEGCSLLLLCKSKVPRSLTKLLLFSLHFGLIWASTWQWHFQCASEIIFINFFISVDQL